MQNKPRHPNLERMRGEMARPSKLPAHPQRSCRLVTVSQQRVLCRSNLCSEVGLLSRVCQKATTVEASEGNP